MQNADRRRLAVVVGATCAIGAVQLFLSWPHLHRQISTDESFTYFAVNGALDDLLGACRSDPAMAAYYAVAFVYAHIVGPSIFALRLLTFACYLGCIGLICRVGLRRTSGPVTVAVLLLLGGTPIVREAVVDARAAIPAALLAVMLAIVIERVLDPVRRGANTLLTASVIVSVLAFVHPSAIGPAGLGWLVCVWAARRAGPRDRVVVAGTGIVMLAALGANVMQADSAEGLVAHGLAGVRETLGLMWGGHAALAVLAIGAVALVVWMDAPRKTLADVAAVASLSWMLVLLIAVPFVTLFVARYLVISSVLLALAVAVLVPRRWRVWLLAVVALVCAVGEVGARDRRPGVGTRWCTVAEIVASDVRTSDVLVFPLGSTVTPVMACLGAERTDTLFSGIVTAPSLVGVDRSNPRDVWALQLDAATLDALTKTQPGGRVLVVRVGENEARMSAFIEELRAHGGDCVDDVRQDQGLTICTFS